MNIRVDLNTPIKDGTEVVFRSPVDCSQVTGLIVYYKENGNTYSKEFAFADANGNNVGDIDHLFAENVPVKVILDVTTSMAFVQNADTNAYLEGRFGALDEGIASCVIVEKAEGETISLTDSSNNPLRGLALYGKTTQNGTPTPTAPIALESAGSSGSLAVSITGKNLFGGEAFADRMVELGATKNAAAETIQYAPGGCDRTKPIFDNFKENTRYTIVITGWNTMATTGTNILNLIIKYADGKVVYVDGSAPLNTEETVKYTTDANNTVAHFGIAHADGMTTLRYNKCGIFEGVITLDEFESYKQAQTLTVSTPNGLPGIPVTSGGNYTDETGQQWVCDEIDLNRGVYVKRIQQETYNGTEAWFFVGDESNHYTSNYRPLLNLTALAKDYTYPVLCSHFKYEPLVRINGGTNIGCYANNGILGIRHGIADMTTIDQWKEWLAQNNLTMQYVLATPIETLLEDVPDYTKLHTNYPNTTVMADGAGIAVTYVADTKNYIDKKFAELAAAIVNNT